MCVRMRQQLHVADPQSASVPCWRCAYSYPNSASCMYVLGASCLVVLLVPMCGQLTALV